MFISRPRGDIILDGVSTSRKTTAQINKMGIARTFQNIRLFANMSVMDNVKIGMHNSINQNLLSALPMALDTEGVKRRPVMKQWSCWNFSIWKT